MPVSANEIQDAYITFFNRAAEEAGFNYWLSFPGDKVTLYATFAQQDEYRAKFDEKTPEQQVTLVYLNLFDRSPESTGLSYWAGHLRAGTLSLDNIALAINRGAQGTDRSGLDLKVQDAQAETQSLATSNAEINGETFTLQAGKDSLEGTERNDLFEAASTSLDIDKTFDANDSFSGGDGIDKLAVDLAADFAGMAGSTVNGIEIVALTNTSAITRSFNLNGFLGVDRYELGGSAGINLQGLSRTDVTLAFIGTQADVSATFASTLTTAGANDYLRFELSGVGEDRSSTAAQVTPAFSLNGVERLSLVTVGSSSFIDLSSAADVSNLVISGDQALTISDVGQKLNTVSGSRATGDLNLALSVGTAEALAVVATGSGNDTITIDTADVMSKAAITGGDGNDTLSITDSKGSSLTFAQSGVETLIINGVLTEKTLQISAESTTDLSTIQLNANTTDNGAVTIVNTGDKNYAVNIYGGAVSTQTLSIDNTGDLNVTVAPTVMQAQGAKTVIGTTIANASAVNATKANNVTFNIDSFVTQSGTLAASKATEVNLNVASGVNGLDIPEELTNFNGTLTATAASQLNISAEGRLSGATINAPVASTVVVNTGLAASSANLLLPTATSLKMTTLGNMTVLSDGSNLSKAQSVQVTSDGNFALDVPLSNVAKLTLAGTEDSGQFNSTAAIGSANLDYDLAITASGLKAGLNLAGTIASGVNLSIDSSEVTGTQNFGETSALNVTLKSDGALEDITYGAINAKATGSGAATITALANKKSLNLDTIGATTSFKTVNIDATGAAGTIVVKDIYATEVVTLNFTNASQGVTVGTGITDVTAGRAVNFTAGQKALTIDTIVENSTTNSLFTGTLKGGAGDDRFNFKLANNESLAITLTGDLVGGADTISVDAQNLVGETKTLYAALSTLIGYKSSEITGGIGADTIIGGVGDDNIQGGNGNDSIVAGNGRDTIVGGKGNDTIRLAELNANAAMDELQYAESGADNADRVTGFSFAAGTNDFIGFSIGNITGADGGDDTLVSMDGTDIAAAVSAGLFSVEAVSVNTALSTANQTNLLVLTNKAATFVAAMGTATITASSGNTSGLDAGKGVAAVWFDTDTNEAVCGYIEDTSVAGTALTSSDTFHEIVRIGMTVNDFTVENIDAFLYAY